MNKKSCNLTYHVSLTVAPDKKGKRHNSAGIINFVLAPEYKLHKSTEAIKISNKFDSITRTSKWHMLNGTKTTKTRTRLQTDAWVSLVRLATDLYFAFPFLPPEADCIRPTRLNHWHWVWAS